MHRGHLAGRRFVHVPVLRSIHLLRSSAVVALTILGVLGIGARADAQGVDGRAAGIQGSVLQLLGPPITIPPTPLVTLPAGGGTDTDSILNIGNLGLPLLGSLVGSDTVTVRTTSAFNASGTPIPLNTGIYSEARVEDLRIGGLVGLLPAVLSAEALTVSCQETPTGLVGGMQIAALNILGIPIATPPLPNLPAISIELLPGVVIGSLALNKQEATTGPGGVQTLTVTGIDLTLLQILGLIGGADLEILKVQCSTTIPTGSSIVPDAGPSAGGTPVTITGTNFLQGATVTFGGTPATSVVVVNETTITAVTPAHVPATVPVIVTTGGGATGPLSFTFLPGPTLTGLDPTSGPLAGGNAVILTGSGFGSSTTGVVVTFGGVPAIVNSVTPTSIAVTAPAGAAPGPVSVVATTPGGTTLPQTYTYFATPTFTGLNPTSGPLAGGNTVILTGSGFGTDPSLVSVSFGGAPATVTGVTPTTITVTAPAGAAPGPVSVTATTAGGTTGPQTYTYFTTPALTGLDPTGGPLAGGNVVTLTGSNFGTNPALVSVSFGGAAATVIGVTPTTITVTAPAGAAPGPVSVTATTPGGTTGPQTYTYFNTPTFTGLNPTSGPLAGGNTVTLTGSGFGSDPTLVSVSFGGAAAAVIGVTPTTITVTAPAGAAPGPVSVTATTPGGTTAPQTYTYYAAPTSTGLNPTSGPLAGGNVVTLTGSNFGTDPTLVSVSFGGAAATVTGVTPTTITVTAPAGAAPGPVSVTATTPGGTTGPQTYTYYATPTFTGLNPTSGPLAGGNVVTLTGSNFGTDPTLVSVSFGPAAATVTGVTPTTITVTAPAGAAPGPVSVTATTPGGTTGPQTYTYYAAPTFTGLNPTSGPLAGGNTVTLTGSDFGTDPTVVSVSFGPAAATVTGVTPTTITVTAPAGAAPGPVSVTATTPGGTTAPQTYTYYAVPTSTGLNPTSGPLAGGNVVTLTGSNFGTDPALVSVSFGPAAATVTGVTPTTITMTAPAGAAPGPVSVTATTPGGTTAPQTYTYYAAPTFTGLNPTSGPLAGGNTVTLTGSNFGTNPALVSVSFGAAAAAVTGVTPTTITVTAPAGAAPGPVSVTATTPGGTTAPQTYTYYATPLFTGLSPASGPLAGGNTVTLTGSSFGTDPAVVSVSFGGVAATVIGVTPTAITVTAPAGAAPGPVSVTATTPGGTTAPQTYTYYATPTFTGLNPTSGPLAGGNTVTLTGTNFGTDPTLVAVTFGGTAATVTAVTPTTITVTAPAGAAPGPIAVTATTPGGTTSPQTYTYYATPTFTSLDPTSGPLPGGNTVTLTGSNFGTDPAAVTVTFGAAAATVTSVTPTSITAIAPAGVVAGPVSVTLTTPGGTGGPLPYTYISTTNLESITPNSGPTTGGTAVLIKGVDFLGAATVTFNGVSATDIVVVNSTTITAKSPAGTPGPAAVIVTSSGGTASGPFIYISVPTITSVTPNAGDAGTPVTIIGSQYMPGATVTICGQTIPAQFISSTEIRFNAPTCLAGGIQSVTVTNPDGGTATAANGFTYTDNDGTDPTLISVVPSSGPKAGGTNVTIKGTHFVAGLIVKFGETQATNVVVVDDTTITATTPPFTANVVDAGVQTATAEGSADLPATANAQADTETPDSSGAPAATSAATAADALPPHVAGIVDVSVTTPTGIATLPDAFSYLLSLPADCAATFELDPNDVEGDPDGDGLTNFEECTSEPPTHPKGFYTRYLAEGAANSFFSLRLAIFNPGPKKSIVLLQFLQSGGGAFNHVVTVNPHQRITLHPATLVGFLFTDFSTTIESDEMVIVDRQMTWDNLTSFGSHAETAVAALSKTWYLAEGSTSDPFSLFYLLQNPHATQTTASIKYLRALGEPPLTKFYNLPPKSRTTVFVDREDPALIQTDVSGVIEASQTIAVERAMYFDQPDQLFAAGHDSAGVTAPATEWFLAEGATGPFFELFVLIANPNPTPAQVRVDYLLLFGAPLTKTYTVPGNSRFTIWVDEEELPAGSGEKPLANVAVSTRLRSENNVPIFVERAMWWPQPVWYEAHNSPATTETGTMWGLAEGETGGPNFGETYVLIANVSDRPGQANVTLYFEDGTTTSKVINLQPTSRVNVQVVVDFPEANGKRFATIVESIGANPAELVVERAMYASPNGQTWGSGTNAVATKLK